MKYAMIDKKGKIKIQNTEPKRGLDKYTEIIKYPEPKDIEVGFQIYKYDGSEYYKIKTINEFYYTVDNAIESIFIIDTFHEKYLNKIFKIMEE